jgi:hypothetical protein
MIVTIKDYKIDIGVPTFGNDCDIQINEQLGKLTELLRTRKTPVPKLDEKAKAIVERIKGLVHSKNAKM